MHSDGARAPTHETGPVAGFAIGSPKGAADHRPASDQLTPLGSTPPQRSEAAYLKQHWAGNKKAPIGTADCSHGRIP
jgi:hypothetical protein